MTYRINGVGSRIQDRLRFTNIGGANKLMLRLMHFESNEQNLTRSKFFPSLIYFVKHVHREYERNINVEKDVKFLSSILSFFLRICVLTTLETKIKLGQVNFGKDFWDC